jgi:hypothetical protein
MNSILSFRILDISVFVVANLTNLLLAVMFLLRGCNRPRTGNVFGWSAVVLGIPLFGVVILNGLANRPWWTLALPALMVAFDLVEFLFDFLLKFDFRHSRWVGLYLVLFYLALMGMIGYGFAVGKPFGFITLATYFVSLAATWYAQSRHRTHGN